MVKFRRPCLIHSWLELAVWVAWPLALGAAGVAGLVVGPAPARVSAALLLAGTIGALVAKFVPRWLDMKHVVYRTKHGVSVVLKDPRWTPRPLVQEALDRAIAAHGNGHRLDGCALYLVTSAHARGKRVNGVADIDMTVPIGDTGDLHVVMDRITHEAGHILLDGHPDTEHAEMATKGTL